MKTILLIMSVISVLALAACAQPGAQTTTLPVITGTPLPVPAYVGPSLTNSSEAPDDIVNTPGGSAYRANVHQQGVPDRWPSIETVESTLSAGPSGIWVRYRSSITTKAGEIRNDIVWVGRYSGGLEAREIDLYAVGAPPDARLLQDAAGGLPGTLSALLVIEIPQDAKPGRYDFKIGVKIEGKDYGILPCSIEVTP